MKNVALILLLALTSCASTGVRVDQSAMRDFHEGRTTRDQIIDRLGEPTNTVRLPDGSTIITYGFLGVQVHPETFIPIVGAFVGGADTEQSTVTFNFNQKGVLKSYTEFRGGQGSGHSLDAVTQSRKETRDVQ